MLVRKYLVRDGRICGRSEIDTDTMNTALLSAAKEVLRRLHAGSRIVSGPTVRRGALSFGLGTPPIPGLDAHRTAARLAATWPDRFPVEETTRRLQAVAAGGGGHQNGFYITWTESRFPLWFGPRKRGIDLYCIIPADYHGEEDAGFYGAVAGSRAAAELRRGKGLPTAESAEPERKEMRAIVTQMVESRPAFFRFLQQESERQESERTVVGDHMAVAMLDPSYSPEAG